VEWVAGAKDLRGDDERDQDRGWQRGSEHDRFVVRARDRTSGERHDREDREREDVEQRLGEQGANDRGQRVGRAAGTPGDQPRACRFAEPPGGDGRARHADQQHPGHRGPADRLIRERGANRRKPRFRAGHERARHQHHGERHPAATDVGQGVTNLRGVDLRDREHDERRQHRDREPPGDPAARPSPARCKPFGVLRPQRLRLRVHRGPQRSLALAACGRW
jgi:hypothetical protein